MQIDHLRTAIAEQVPRLQSWEVDGLAKKLESAGLIAPEWVTGQNWPMILDQIEEVLSVIPRRLDLLENTKFRTRYYIRMAQAMEECTQALTVLREHWKLTKE